MLKFPNPASFKIDLGELDAEFRAHFFKDDVEQTRLAIAITVIAVGSLSSIDYILYQNGREFLVLLFARGLFILYSALAAALLSRVSSVKAFETVALIWGLGFVILTSYIDFTRPPDFTQNPALHILMAFSAYILLPTQPRNRMIAPILLTLGNLWIILTIKNISNAAWLGVTVSTYLLLHLAGILTAVRTFNARKTQFLAEHEQRRINEQLRQLAITDELTGIYNRRFFLERAREEFERYFRHRHPLSLMIADLDLLKQVNDTHGHHVGDLAIRQFTNLVAREKRATDIFGRLGGEEFGLLLPDTSLEEARVVVNRIYEERRLLLIRTTEKDIAFTFTAGLAECRPEYQTLDDLLRVADLLLYRGKARGRDRVEVDEQESG